MSKINICGCSKFLRTNQSINEYPDGKEVKNYWIELERPSNSFENSILWGTKWNFPDNILKYTINLGGATSVSVPGYDSVNLINIDFKQSIDTMMDDLKDILDISVKYVDDVNNAFISINFLDADNNNFNFLGIAMPPVNSNDAYYTTDSTYTSLTSSFWASGNTYLSYKNGQDYSKGSFMYSVMIHELGHSLGLAHPHDNGGNSSIMAGVTSAFRDYGTYNSNIHPITCMSYNDNDSPILNKTTGYMGTFGPLDIKVLQTMYGISSTNNGNTTYTLSNYWTCINDTSGVDTIDASSSTTNTTIDIQSSTLENKKYAGVKFSYNMFGGITITQNSTIENVIDSSNDDTISGNQEDNTITLTGGSDDVNGRLGFDIVYINANLSDFTYSSSGGVIEIKNNTDTICLTNVEKIIFLDSEMLVETNVVETGNVQVSHIPVTINLQKTFTNPIVCCSDPTLNGGAPCTVKISNITDSSFTIYLQEPSNNDGKHAFEKISWIVGEKGSWNSDTNQQVVFDTYTSNLTTRNGFQTINFSKPFLQKPVVLTQVASINGTQYVLTRTRNINTNSFQCSMQEQESSDNLHATERIDWCAFSPGSYNFNGKIFECNTISNVNHVGKNISFDTCSSPDILTRCSTYNGGDPVNTRIQNVSFTIRLQEDTTRDREIGHVNEDVSFIAIKN